MSATVLAADLARIISDAAIFSSRDTTLPMINAVQLESTAKHLMAVGTDRFTMGASVAEYTGKGPAFTATMGLPQAQLVAKVASGRMAITFQGLNKPAMVSVGLQFVGIIMPIRLGEADAGSTYPEWLIRPKPPAAPKKRAPRKAPAKKAVA